MGVGAGVGRVWLRMWGEGKGETVTTKSEVCGKLHHNHVIATMLLSSVAHVIVC